MWPRNFPARLDSWSNLRSRCDAVDKQTALETVNTWWFTAPWSAYYLHWDDQLDWPDPWQLLNDNIYCPVARALGIMYTIAMLDRTDLQDVVMVEYLGDNLVLVDNGKYILNWDNNQIVNISLGPSNPRRRVSLAQIKQNIR